MKLLGYQVFFGIHISKMGLIVNLRTLMKNYAVLSEIESMPTTWELSLLFVAKRKVHIGFYSILNQIRNVRYWYLGCRLLQQLLLQELLQPLLKLMSVSLSSRISCFCEEWSYKKHGWSKLTSKSTLLTQTLL